MIRAKLSGNPYFSQALSMLFAVDPRVIKSGDDWYLESRLLDDTVGAGREPEPAGLALLNRMNVVARAQLPSFQPVVLSGEWDGYTPIPTFRLAGTSVMSGLPAFDADPEVAGKILRVAESSEQVARAMRFLNGTGGAPDWFDLYKVLEIVKDGLQSDAIRKFGKTKKTTGRVNEALAGLSDVDQLKIFTESANRHEVSGDLARHAELPGTWSGKAMPLREATTLISRLFVAWVVAYR